MHDLIKKQLKSWSDDNKDYTEYMPKKSRELRAVSFESKQPLGDGKYFEYLFQCMEWDNGEGFDFTWHTYNQKTGESTDKHVSLHTDVIDGLLFCINDLKYFV